MGTFFRNTGWGIIKGVYTAKINRFRPSILKRAPTLGGGELSARFRAKGIQEFSETNESGPTVQLPSIRAFLALVAYRARNFWDVGVPRSFLRPNV